MEGEPKALTQLRPNSSSRNAVMSCLVMRPPSPVPGTCARLMLCSRAILRTSGDERAWSSSSCEAWACTGGAGAGGPAALGSAAGAGVLREPILFCRRRRGPRLAAALSPSAEIVPTTVFTWTVAPSATLMSCRTPEAGAGISASTLSVEISNSGSSRCTLSPGFFSHLVMVPSKIDSPIWGMTISVGIIPFHAAHCSEARNPTLYISAGNPGGPAISSRDARAVLPGDRLPGGATPVDFFQ